ncbi:metal/formaldehyde-sensitive transcriptional repressor [Vogesella sp. LYT5W]|uniref:Metal/formaldehyde-sensitive transcriptional repressor n=1 Tax=Vogesella margarita TaxID=2984199 RepID=A0ABT5IS86_9NEIS|nr:metal/formaldehyde-sensitive transcriptional repressor [Vogesella margarita]MDC7715417.1 metal/formaldehyde-sensitive transcriptional repressor [Vogesella margarita]
MSHLLRNNKPLLSRVRRIKGQAEALERALEGDADCSAVLQQIAAIRGAVNGLMAGVLEDHIREHIGAADISAEARNAEIDQLVGILRSYLK